MIRNIITIGFHDRKSPRHCTVCEELTRGEGTVIECHTEARGFFAKCLDLRKKFRARASARALAPSAPTVLVPFPGHFLMPLAWILTRRPRRRLIFDAFISLYDTDVSDRHRYSPLHPWAWTLWMIDWISMHLADEVLIDTEADRQFLIRTFHLQPDRVRVIYLESRSDLFFPRNPQHETRNPFEVFFYGTLIPLHGIDYILAAAKILEEQNTSVHFTMVGSSKLRQIVEDSGLRNVTVKGFVPMETLPEMIRSADLCLGIFGTSDKAKRVIPHKVVDAVACGVPVLTADTPGIRERFANHPLVHLIPAGSPEEIAAKILSMRKP